MRVRAGSILTKLPLVGMVAMALMACNIQAADPITPDKAGKILEQVLKLTAGKPAGLEWGMVRGTKDGLGSWVEPVESPPLVLQGNAWLTARHPDGSFEVVDSNLYHWLFKPGADYDDLAGPHGGEWVPVPMAADAAKLDAWLAKVAENPGRSGEPLRQDTARGRLLFWYAMAGAAGLAEAPAKAADLLNGTEGRERMLDQILSSQAEAAVLQAATVVLRNGDWKAYLTSLEKTLATYTRTWEARPQVKEWIDFIRPVIAQPREWLDGVEALTPEQKGRAKAIFDWIIPLYTDLPAVPWLLPPGKKMESTDPKVREVLAALRESGRELMPAWIALLADSSLVAGWAPVERKEDDSYSYSRRSAQNTTETWKQVERPAQRREIAEAILAGVMPDEQLAPWRKFGGPDKAAGAWWSAYGKESEPGLALNYALYGSGPMQLRGLAMVVESGDEKALAKLEKDLLSKAAQDSSDYRLLGQREFISLRGKAASGFVDSLLASLKTKLGKQMEQYAENDSSGRYRKQVEEWLKSEETQLKALLEQRPLTETLADFLSGKLAGPTGLQSVTLALQRVPYEEAVRETLQAAVVAPRQPLIWYMLNALGGPGVVDGADRAGRLAIFQAHRPLLEKLLAADVVAKPTPFERPRFRIRASTYLEFILTGGNREGWTGLEAVARLGETEELAEKAAKRALELLDDKPVTAWPTLTEEDTSKAEAHWESLAGLDASATGKKLSGLTPLEVLALEDVEEEWPEGLSQWAWQINAVRFGGEKIEGLAALQGKKLELPVLREILTQTHAAAGAGRNVIVTLIRQGLHGYRLDVESGVALNHVRDSAGYVRTMQEPAPPPAEKQTSWMVVGWTGNRYAISPWWGAAPVLPEAVEASDSGDEEKEAAEDEGEGEKKEAAKPAPVVPEKVRDGLWKKLCAQLLSDLEQLKEAPAVANEFTIAAGPGAALPATPEPLDVGMKTFLDRYSNDE